MQIDVHAVDAQIDGPHPADDRIEIGAVRIEKTADIVDGTCDFQDLVLEEAAGVRVRQHDRGYVRPKFRPKGV